jgi:type II secretory pathway pseudopilin PulG
MRERGFSLVEALIATSLLAGAIVTLAQLVGAAAHSGSAARARAATTWMAEQKMEQLRALPWAAIAAARDEIDYLDESGNVRCPRENAPCGEAVYVRRWSATPMRFSAGILFIEVDVSAVGKGHGRTTLVTARARMTP